MHQRYQPDVILLDMECEGSLGTRPVNEFVRFWHAVMGVALTGSVNNRTEKGEVRRIRRASHKPTDGAASARVVGYRRRSAGLPIA